MHRNVAAILVLCLSTHSMALEPPDPTPIGAGSFSSISCWGKLDWDMSNEQVSGALKSIGIDSDVEELQSRNETVTPDGRTEYYCEWTAMHIFDLDGWRLVIDITNGRMTRASVAWLEPIDAEEVDSLLSWLAGNYGPATATQPENHDYDIHRAYWDNATTRLEVRTYPENGLWRVRMLYSSL